MSPPSWAWLSVDRAHSAGLGPRELVGAYKDLKFNEAGFKSLKAIDLDLRPIHHWTEPRVRAHVLICMLALHLVWHLRKAWAPICFTDEAPVAPTDPVAPARRSDGALAKVSRRKDEGGEGLHSFATPLASWVPSPATPSPLPAGPASPSWPCPRPSSDGPSSS